MLDYRWNQRGGSGIILRVRNQNGALVMTQGNGSKLHRAERDEPDPREGKNALSEKSAETKMHRYMQSGELRPPN